MIKQNKAIKFLIFLMIFLSIAPIVASSTPDIYVNQTGWWRADGAFNESATQIQAAIDNATDGDTIYVYNGSSYTENVNVNKAVTLQGNGSDVVTVTVALTSDHVFDVTADYVNISGFKVTGATDSGKAGIYLSSSVGHGNISNNNASNNDYGIYLDSSNNNNTLSGNTANSNTNTGISLTSSSNNNTLRNNTANSNYNGIVLSSSSNNNTLTNNTANSNDNYGIILQTSNNNNTIYNNYFNNTNNAYDDGYNVWNTTKTAGTNIIGGSWLGGNYWSDYAGEDTDGDRLGDTLTPYNSGNIANGGDYHPLTTTSTFINVNTTGWWRAGGAFNATSTRIQAAINNATAGDTIYVYNGSYTENVNVNKRVTLQGEGAGVVNVTAASTSDHVFDVTVDYVNISGFKVTGATSPGMVGIYLGSVGHCNISDNIASNNYDGIDLSSSSNNTLTNNTANSNTFGIEFVSSSNNTLTNNTVNSNTQRGINLQSSSNNNTLTYNTANSNTAYGIVLESSSNNTIYNNYFNNTNNAFDDGYNVWNTTITSGTNIVGGSRLGGNYWSNYAGADTDGDGLGDTLIPYTSGHITNGGDYHPLMNLDTTVPSITIISPENKTYITASISLNVTTNQTANVTYSLNGGTNLSLYNLTTSGNKTITGTEGANNITVYANDSAGNLNSSIVYFTVSTAPVVTASKTYSNYTQIIKMTIDSNITVTDGETNVTGATVSIGDGYVSSEDYLNYTTINGITGSYSTSTGILTLTGNRSGSDYQAAFRNVSYWNNNTNNPNTSQRNITFAIGNNSLYYPGTGHYYEFVSPTLNWINANTSANTESFYGLKGYLATINSSDENTFIHEKVSGDAWIGASDSAVEGDWKWVTGPEAGTLFYQGTGASHTTFGYNNWVSPEPNNAGGVEDFAEMYSTGGGTWNDLSGTDSLII